MKTQIKPDATVFKAFCDENRLRILGLLKSGEKCACNLLDELKITQSTLSHHMKILCDAEIVDSRKEGKWTHYSINKIQVKKAQDMLGTLLVFDNEKTTKRSCCD